MLKTPSQLSRILGFQALMSRAHLAAADRNLARAPAPGTIVRGKRIQANELYIFRKSGNEVRAIEPSGSYLGIPMWTVERTKGASAGKRMCVPVRALDPVPEPSDA